jgi:hypothetical protein
MHLLFAPLNEHRPLLSPVVRFWSPGSWTPARVEKRMVAAGMGAEEELRGAWGTGASLTNFIWVVQ